MTSTMPTSEGPRSKGQLREHVVQAALAWSEAVNAQRSGDAIRTAAAEREVSAAERRLSRVVAEYQRDSWRNDDAIELVKLLMGLAKGDRLLALRKAEILRRAEVFVGQRTVSDDTTPPTPPPRRVLRRRRA